MPDRPAAFIEGRITQIMNNTKQYAVQCGLQVQTVRRGQIRLMRPPWWDELSDMTMPGPSGLTNTTAVPTTMPAKFDVAAADANTIRSIVNNSASSVKTFSHQHLHQLSNNSTNLTTTVGATTVDMQTNLIGISCNKSLSQRSRMSYGVSKFEPISTTHTSISSVRLLF